MRGSCRRCAMASTLPPSQVLRARRIELVDAHGEIKITLDAQAEGSVIRFWGKDKQLKASLGLHTTDQPALLFLDGYVPRIDLRLEKDGQPGFGMVYDRAMNACEILIENAKRLDRQAKRKAKKGQVQAPRKEG